MRTLFVLLLLAGAAEAAPMRIAFRPLVVADGVTTGEVALLNDAIVAALRRRPGLQVVTPTEISALLSFEEQRQLIGCDESDCLVNLGGALGCDELVVGSLGLLGESWLLNLRRLDVRKVITRGQADRRLRNASLDDVLDALPGLVAELFPPPPTSPAVVARRVGFGLSAAVAIGALVTTAVFGAKAVSAGRAEDDALEAYRSSRRDLEAKYADYLSRRDVASTNRALSIGAAAATLVGAGSAALLWTRSPVRPLFGSAGDVGVAFGGSF
jgi:hypothetical protein